MELNPEKIRQGLFAHIVHSSKDPRMAQLYIATQADLYRSRQTVAFLEYTFAGFLDEIDHYLSFLINDEVLCGRHGSEIERMHRSLMNARKAVGCC